MTHTEQRLRYERAFIVRLRMFPRDVDSLTVAEFERCRSYVDEMSEGG